MNRRIVIVLACLLTTGTAAEKIGWPLARIAVHVADERGVPVEGAEVEIHFREKLSNRNQWIVGETNGEGSFSGEGHSDRRLAANVRKEGYYDSGTGWTIFTDPISGKWQPWDATAEVILRPIGKPVPLMAKRVQTDIPALDQA